MMIIKEFGGRIASVWEGLRPMTRNMLVGALQIGTGPGHAPKSLKFSYDAHADWELSRLLSAIDEQSRTDEIRGDAVKLDKITRLADTCVQVLESQSGSAEVFIQLAERALRQHDYHRLDKLSDKLAERFSAGEIAEIIRQSEAPQIRAIAFETLAMLPIPHITPLLEDSLYSDIAANALEQKAFEYGSDEAREVLERLDAENERRSE